MKKGFLKWAVNVILGVLLAAVILTLATFSPNVDLMARLIHVDDEIRPADVIVAFSSAEVRDCEHHLHLLDREEYAVKLWRQGLSKSGKIIFTGRQVHPKNLDQISVDSCRRKLAREMKIPESALILDNEATSTHENAVGTAKIMQMEEWHDALLVTDTSHALRARKSLEKQGVRVYLAQIPLLGYWDTHKAWFDSARITYLHQFLYEYVALFLYQCYGYI